MALGLDDILNGIDAFGPLALEALLPEELAKLLESVTTFATNIARAIEAGNEKALMQASVKAVEAQIDAEQQAENKLVPQ